VKTLHDDEKDDSFQNKAESLEYAQRRTYFSINNTCVNSKAEKEIMDFFLMNKLNGEPIAVDYEPDLPGFRPDFGLPKYDLFIEHWALNEKGEVPEWFDQTTEDYKEKMQFKKEWFARNNKLLVETFAHEYDETNPDGFIESLKKRVIEKLQTRNDGKFEFAPLTYNELIEVAWGPYKDPVDEMANFITNAKTYGISPEKITEKLRSGKWSRKQVAFGNLAVKIYADYRNYSVKTKKIDFEDMINEAIAELDNDKNLCANIYDHILIDEYQDISAQRYRLISKLLERNPSCKLFCVGDDWQSIMAFSGSNLDFFVNFEEYFEKPAITKISTNYRSIKTIVDAGAYLIKKNGSCQISKTALSSRDEERAIKVLRSPHKENYRMRYYEQTAEDCLARIADYVKKGFSPKDILVLSRFMRTKVHRAYKFHHVIRILMDRAQEMGIDMICDDARDENRIRVLTVHKSKGLEAKAVFVLNVIKDAYGFPCEIEDNSIYAPARENYPETDPKEEERRLFYVAMTRAREDLIIYTWEPSKSEFLGEIGNYTQEERLGY
jgi:DNA helicase-4